MLGKGQRFKRAKEHKNREEHKKNTRGTEEPIRREEEGGLAHFTGSIEVAGGTLGLGHDGHGLQSIGEDDVGVHGSHVQVVDERVHLRGGAVDQVGILDSGALAECVDTARQKPNSVFSVNVLIR